MARSKLITVNQKIAKELLGAYKKIEEAVVGGYNQMADKFVEQYLTKEGESVKEGRKRLVAEQIMRRAEHR